MALQPRDIEIARVARPRRAPRDGVRRRTCDGALCRSKPFVVAEERSELADALRINAAQEAQVPELKTAFQTAAVALGHVVLAAESALDAERATSTPDPEHDAKLSDAVRVTRGRLRDM